MKRDFKNSSMHYFIAFTGCMSLRNNLKYILNNSKYVDKHYMTQALMGYLFHITTSLISLPLRSWEHYKINQSTDRLPPPLKAPVFIVGHWRSGTTFLHNLLAQDKRFAYCTLFQTLANDMCVFNKWSKSFFEYLIPKIRPMDDINFSVDNPQEEEHAMARISPYSFYHQWCFPRRGRAFFNDYVLFQNVPETTCKKWKETYLSVLQRASMAMDNKPLLLKNPANTARIRLLLEMFPDAKFIHIYRNPYTVFKSTRRLYERTLRITQLQQISQDEIDQNILYFYRKLMEKYLTDYHEIPAHNLVELSYENLVGNPMKELHTIYDHLGLPRYDGASSAFEKYCSEQAHFRTNRYSTLPSHLIDRINRQWSFAFKRWHYPLIEGDRPMESVSSLAEPLQPDVRDNDESNNNPCPFRSNLEYLKA